MKKVLSMLLVFTLVVGMLSACSGEKNTQTAKEGEATPGKDITLEFWTIALQPTFTEFFNALISQYEKENPGVTIVWKDLPYDSIQEKLVTAAAGGTSPDVVNLNTQFALTLAGKGALVDLAKEATDEQKSIYVESLYESAKIGESVYAFPWYASPNIMIYNKALFEQAGIQEIPTNYQEAFEMAKTMKDKTGAYLYNPPEFFNLLFEEGVPIVNDDKTEAAFNSPETAQLLSSFKEMTDADYLPKTNWGKWDNEIKLFETGKLAIISSSGSTLSRVQDEAPDIYENLGIAPPLTGNLGLSRNALMNLVVPSASKNHEEAIKFAAYITNDANQLAFCKQVAIFPSTKEAIQDAYFTSDDTTLEGLARIMSVQVSQTSKDYSLGMEGQNEIQTNVNKVYEGVITSNKDIQTTLDEVEESINNLLKQ